MGGKQITTRTRNTKLSDGSGALLRAAPSFIRFFRADDVFDPFEEFSLANHSQWLVGRIQRSLSLLSHRPDGQIWSCDDFLMSSRHATLSASAEGWRLADAGSKNGTFVNGARLQGPHLLREGDVIECGHSFFVYREPKISPAPTGGPVSLDQPPMYYQMAQVFPFISSDIGIHLFGETGTGKEVVARAIHAISRRPGAFVGINCAAIPESLFESELFGHAKGAFSGATERKTGHILNADEGTLFLDEIGELSPLMQAKLLRVLELREVLPVGASKPIPVNFRLVSATLCNLKEMVEAGKFRRDLYAHLGQALTVPPLRHNIEQFGQLVQTFVVARLTERRKSGKAPMRVYFSLAASRALIRYSWPFNVRELKHCIDAALISAIAEKADSDMCAIDLRHLPATLSAAPHAPPRQSGLPRPIFESVERGRPSRWGPRPTEEEICDALKKAGGHRAKTAELLGTTERTLYRWLEELRVDEDSAPSYL